MPGNAAEHVSFTQKVSLLDWDVIIFSPEWGTSFYSSSEYQGKPSLGDSSSFRLQELVDHWRRELLDAYEAGKTVVTFLCDYEEVFVDSGQRTYSGTGRNRQETRIVRPLNNYKTLPLDIQIVSSEGKAMRLTPDAQFLKEYWTHFGDRSVYKVLASGRIGKRCVSTRAGDKTVGSLIRHKTSGGAILLLPDLDFEASDLWKETETGEEVWTKVGMTFGQSLLHSVLEIDAFLKESGASNPMPEWAAAAEFSTAAESEIQQKLLKIEGDVEKLNRKKASLKEKLQGEASLRRLLYDKGPGLEAAIIEALAILGFEPRPFRDDQREFDVVLESVEGRFLGEAEGKDSKPINIDKIRQLVMNIHEDFERDEVSELARGVLFGNAFRLAPPKDRQPFFTEKCQKAAVREGLVLVRTPDLFEAARFVKETGDDEFATRCRQALLKSPGKEVEFPPTLTGKETPPVAGTTTDNH